jgi:hypothetical protein
MQAGKLEQIQQLHYKAIGRDTTAVHHNTSTFAYLAD